MEVGESEERNKFLIKLFWFKETPEYLKGEYENFINYLERIKEKWKIDYSIQRVSYDEEWEIYRDYFLTNRGILQRNTGVGVSVLRSGSGNVSIIGTITIEKDGRPILFFGIKAPLEPLEALEKIDKEGPEFIKKIIAENRKKGSKHEKLVMRFLEEAKNLGFTGELIPDFALQIPELETFGVLSIKEIDVVHRKGKDEYDVIEIKPGNLHWDAIGQVLGYSVLLAKMINIDSEKIGKYIICEGVDDFYQYVCEKLNIKVLILKEE